MWGQSLHPHYSYNCLFQKLCSSAVSLKIESLFEECSLFYVNKLSESNCLRMFVLSQTFEVEDLIPETLSFIEERIRWVLLFCFDVRIHFKIQHILSDLSGKYIFRIC